MYAKITEDLLFKQWPEDSVYTDRTGHVIFNGPPVGKVRMLRLLDDDRIPYYIAEADEEAEEFLFEWAMHDSGVTIVQELSGNGWKDYMN